MRRSSWCSRRTTSSSTRRSGVPSRSSTRMRSGRSSSRPTRRPTTSATRQTGTRMRYRMYPFYHPYTALFLRELDRSGIDRLLTRRLQQSPQTYFPGNSFGFAADYLPGPTTDVDPTAATDRVDFEPYGAYSIYNWETFFHAPLLIATQAEPEPAVRGGDALVPLHLRPDERRGPPDTAALLGHPAVLRAERRRVPEAADREPAHRSSARTWTRSGPGGTIRSTRT